MTLNSFIQALATKSGIKEEQIKDLLDSTKEIEMPVEIANLMQGKLMTAEGAKNNPEIISHFRSTILDGADVSLNKALSDLGLEGLKTELSEEKNTYERIKKALKSIHELKKDEDGKGNEEKVKAYKEQIESLNSELAKFKTDFIPKTELEEVTNKYNSKVKSFYLDSILSKYEYSTDLAKEENHLLPKTKLEKALNEAGYKLNLTDNGLNLATLDDTEPFSKDNQKVTLDGFIESTLAKSNLLKVQGNEPEPTPTPQPGKGGGIDTSDALAMIGKQMAEIQD